MFKRNMIDILVTNPDAEIQIELDSFTDNKVSPEEIAREAKRKVRIIYSTMITGDSVLELYERWAVFPAEDKF